MLAREGGNGAAPWELSCSSSSEGGTPFESENGTPLDGGSSAASSPRAGAHSSRREGAKRWRALSPEQDIEEELGAAAPESPRGATLSKVRDALLASVAASEHEVSVSFHLRCFYGAEAVGSLVAGGLCANGEAAAAVCRQLLRAGALRPVHALPGVPADRFEPVVLYYFVEGDAPLAMAGSEPEAGGDAFLASYLRHFAAPLVPMSQPLPLPRAESQQEDRFASPEPFPASPAAAQALTFALAADAHRHANTHSCEGSSAAPEVTGSVPPQQSERTGVVDFAGVALERSAFEEADFPCGVRLMLVGCRNAPDSFRGFRETHYYVQIDFVLPSGAVAGSARPQDKRLVHTKPAVRCGSSEAEPGGVVSWMEFLSLGHELENSTELEVSLNVYHRRSPIEVLGRTTVTLGALSRRGAAYRDLWLVDPASDELARGVNGELTMIRLGVEPASLAREARRRSSLGPSLPVPGALASAAPLPASAPVAAPVAAPPSHSAHSAHFGLAPGGFAKHVMMITRGTRGDVQPFVALARSLAEQHGWLVTIVTEARYRGFVLEHAGKLTRGRIRFRPSGGDTQKRLEGPLARWAVQTDSALMQHAMLAMSEYEFFPSEPAVFHWARELRPDLLCFGFTMAHIAMVASEALRIPLMGFVMQPTVIPSAQYPPLHVTNQPKRLAHYLIAMSHAVGNHFRHTTLASAKALMENNPLSGLVTGMRRRRGLAPVDGLFSRRQLSAALHSNTWMQLQEQRVPLVCPVNKYAFGGKPKDWAPSSVFTNYIFLRGATVPPLAERLVAFLAQARAEGRKVVALAFSSMPIERDDILRIAVRLATECRQPVAVVALLGDKPNQAGPDARLERAAAELQHREHVFVDAGAPFGRLFPLCDAVVIHGGLGTTGEALMAGKPVVITGVLLFDQRFWGRRLNDLRVGPNPVHINRLLGVCVDIVDKALEEDSEWARNAEQVGRLVADTMQNDPAGVDCNARAVVDMARAAPVFNYSAERAADYRFYENHRTFSRLYATSKTAAIASSQQERQLQLQQLMRTDSAPAPLGTLSAVAKAIDSVLASTWMALHWTAAAGHYAASVYHDSFRWGAPAG